MASHLNGRRVAILATDGVEEIEYTLPRAAVEEAGATAELVSIKPGRIQAMRHMDKSDTFPVDRTVQEANPGDYDALLLPGGVANPDRLRLDPAAVQFVAAFFEQNKPVAAICHAPWTLVEADVVDGRTLTSYPSLRTDIVNAGGRWVNEEVHVDRGLITSRDPGDLEAFCKKIVEELAASAAARGPDA